VKALLGVDPLTIAQRNPLERYLERACAGLPPKNSKEREEIRNGISLQDYLEKMKFNDASK
jgi:hypothetical protein